MPAACAETLRKRGSCADTARKCFLSCGKRPPPLGKNHQYTARAVFVSCVEKAAPFGEKPTVHIVGYSCEELFFSSCGGTPRKRRDVSPEGFRKLAGRRSPCARMPSDGSFGKARCVMCVAGTRSAENLCSLAGFVTLY